MVNILKSLSIPLLVIEADAASLTRLNRRNIPALYGDAGNSDVIAHAHLESARALVTTVPDESTAMMIVTAARDINPNLQIIARAATEDGVRHLAKLGADHVVHPELEGGLELDGAHAVESRFSAARCAPVCSERPCGAIATTIVFRRSKNTAPCMR